jgi:PAS domain S-box-containing protein
MQGNSKSDSIFFKFNILIAEGNREELFLLTSMFESKDYTICSALTGQDALVLAETLKPDLLLLDSKLPDFDGYDICTRLKANKKTRHIPVIFLLSSSNAEDKRRVFTVGGDDCITKPFISEEVLSRIQSQAELIHLRRQVLFKESELLDSNNLLLKEGAERQVASENFRDTLTKMETSQAALFNLLDDLETEKDLRKKNEESLNVSEQRFRDFIENASDVVFTIDRNGIFTYVSPDKETYINKFANIALGSSFERFIFPDDIKICREFIAEIVTTGEELTSPDYRIKQLDGSVRWHSTRGSATRDKDGKIIGILGIARDITDRKLIEESLRISEEKFRKAFLTSPDSININRLKDGMYISINKGFTQIMGYSEDQVIGKTSKEVNIWKNPNDRTKLVKELLLKGSVENLEAEFLSRTGEVKYGLMSATLIKLKGEAHILSFVRDITDRRLSEEALRKSESLYRLLANHMTDTIWLLDLDLNPTYISPSVFKLIGYNLEEIREMPIDKLLKPDSYKLVSQLFSEDIAKITTEQEYIYSKTVEVEFACKDGSTVLMEISISLIRNEKGRPASILVEGRDIGARRQVEESLRKSEEKLSFYIKNSPMAVIEWDSDFIITQWTGDSQKIFGWKPEETIGKTILDLRMVFEPDIPLVRNTMERLSAGIYTKVISSNRNYKKNRSIINCEWYYTVLKDKQGKMLSTMTQILDITERKSAEREIHQLKQKLEKRVADRTSQLEAANIELEAFSYSVSHDLQAPLRHISGFISLFLEKKTAQLTEDEMSYLNTVTDSAKEMGLLIEALLTFSRLNRIELKKTPIETSHLIRQGLQLYDKEIRERKIKVIISKLEESFSDLQLMRQVWTNLISNAVKYTGKKKEAVIEIGSYIENDDSVFYIKDNGAGFDMRYYDKLFGVFQRLHKPRDFEGVGIGLANVKRVVSRHGGKCWAEGAVGKGATFYFSLPNEKSTFSA